MKLLKVSKQDANISYFGSWDGLGGGADPDDPVSLPEPSGGDSEIQLEAISDYVGGQGFTGIGRKFYRSDYSALIEGTDFDYDEPLDGTESSPSDVYDDADSGPLGVSPATGLIRVVHDGENISKASGGTYNLGITPRAKEMASNNFTPPDDEIWVDPPRGKIVVPRPVYWSDASSVDSFKDKAKILPRSDINLTWMYTPQFTAGKFGNCLHFNNVSSGPKLRYYPLGVSPENGADKLVYEFWLQLSNGGGQYPFVDLRSYDASLNVKWQIQLCWQGSVWFHVIYVNGIQYASGNFDLSSSLHHIYIVVDYTVGGSGNLSGGKSIIVYVDGDEKMSTTIVPTASAVNFSHDQGTAGTAYYGTSWLDNPKCWDRIVSETPDWVYNGGAGIEKALHPLWGAVNNYQPDLEVGYYQAGNAGSLLRWTLR